MAKSDWKEIVCRGVESEELDYKAPQNWHDIGRAGKAKFARHCMALANTKGGYIVIGVGEDRFGRPAVYDGMTEAQARSFDPTDVGSFINRIADPAIDFDLVRPVVDGKQYVIVVVRRFNTLPHVCCYSLNGELQQGAFYIRTKDASSRVAFRASEVQGLVQRALRNQREFLGRMLRGILYENRQRAEPEAEQSFREELRHSRHFFERRHPPLAAGSGILLELSSYPDHFRENRFGVSLLRRAAEEASFTFRELPFAPVGNDEETYSTNVSLRSCRMEPPIVWQAYQSGLFHHQSLLPLRAGAVPYGELCNWVAEGMFFLAQYYAALDCGEELLTIDFRLLGVEDQRLAWGERLPEAPKRFICRIPEVHVQLRRTAPDLVSGVAEHAARQIREICERFNVSASEHGDLSARVEKHLQRRN